MIDKKVSDLTYSIIFKFDFKTPCIFLISIFSKHTIYTLSTFINTFTERQHSNPFNFGYVSFLLYLHLTTDVSFHVK